MGFGVELIYDRKDRTFQAKKKEMKEFVCNDVDYVDYSVLFYVMDYFGEYMDYIFLIIWMIFFDYMEYMCCFCMTCNPYNHEKYNPNNQKYNPYNRKYNPYDNFNNPNNPKRSTIHIIQRIKILFSKRWLKCVFSLY